MRSEISFDHHSFQNDPGMTVFGHSDLILSFETKDERNEVDKVPTRVVNGFLTVIDARHGPNFITSSTISSE